MGDLRKGTDSSIFLISNSYLLFVNTFSHILILNCIFSNLHWLVPYWSKYQITFLYTLYLAQFSKMEITCSTWKNELTMVIGDMLTHISVNTHNFLRGLVVLTALALYISLLLGFEPVFKHFLPQTWIFEDINLLTKMNFEGLKMSKWVVEFFAMNPILSDVAILCSLVL